MSTLDLSSLEVGKEIFNKVLEDNIDEIQIVKYAGAAGGFNPIHFVDEVGKKAGFGGVIAQGMLVMGIASKVIMKLIPYHALQQFSSRFVGVTKPNEKLRMVIKVDSVEQKLDGELIVCSFIIESLTNEKKLEGNFKIGRQK